MNFTPQNCLKNMFSEKLKHFEMFGILRMPRAPGGWPIVLKCVSVNFRHRVDTIHPPDPTIFERVNIIYQGGGGCTPPPPPHSNEGLKIKINICPMQWYFKKKY